MNRKIAVIGAALTTIVAQLGCAQIGLHDPRIQERVVSTSTEQVPVQGLASGTGKVESTVLVVEAAHVCDTVTRSDIEKTAVHERYNAEATTTWAMGIAGIAATGVGTALLIDSRNVYADDETSRTYNPTGPTKALLWGSALTATGVALGTVALVHVFSAQGEETTKTTGSRDSEPEKRSPCANVPLADVNVVGRSPSNGATYKLGTTGPDGRLAADLSSLLPDEFDWNNRRLDVLIEGEPVAQVDLTNIFKDRENAAWDALPVSECRTPRKSTACDPIAKFLKKYPNGPHSAEGDALLQEMEPALALLRDKETWISIDTGECRNGVFKTPEAGVAACLPYHEYLSAYPNGAHANEARDALKEAEKRIAKLKHEEEQAVKRAEAAERAAAAREESEERKRCIGRCTMGCSTWKVANPAACRAGCIASQCGGDL